VEFGSVVRCADRSDDRTVLVGQGTDEAERPDRLTGPDRKDHIAAPCLACERPVDDRACGFTKLRRRDDLVGRSSDHLVGRPTVEL
jgi:hypothetical protein